MHARVCKCGCTGVGSYMCVCKYVSGLVCLFTHLGAGENTYVCVCVHVCAVGSAIQDPNQSRLLWGVSVPSPWLVGDNRNFLELRAPEVALLIRKRKEGNPVSK